MWRGGWWRTARKLSAESSLFILEEGSSCITRQSSFLIGICLLGSVENGADAELCPVRQVNGGTGVLPQSSTTALLIGQVSPVVHFDVRADECLSPCASLLKVVEELIGEDRSFRCFRSVFLHA